MRGGGGSQEEAEAEGEVEEGRKDVSSQKDSLSTLVAPVSLFGALLRNHSTLTKT